MSVRTFCDRCDNRINPGYVKNQISVYDGSTKLELKKDICVKCKKEFEEWFNVK